MLYQYGRFLHAMKHHYFGLTVSSASGGIFYDSLIFFRNWAETYVALAVTVR